MEPLPVTAGRHTPAIARCAGFSRLSRLSVVLAAMSAAMSAATLIGCAPKPEQTDIAIELPAEVERGLELRWAKVPGADHYRMVFKRMTGAALCTLSVEAAKVPSYVIVRDSLPAGLAHGWQLDMEMHAMRNGKPMAATGTRPLKIP